MRAQVINGGVVVNIVVLADGSTIAAGGGSWTEPGGATHATVPGSILMAQDGAQIGWTLANGVLEPPAAPATVLRAYANTKVESLRAIARSYTLTGSLTVLCDAAPSTGTDLVGLKTWGDANAGATTNWVQNDGGVVTLTGAQSVELAGVVLAYAQSVFAALALAMNGIANGTITTTAQIAALSWPA
jgi:hypothetical protein